MLLVTGCAEYHFKSEVPEQLESVRLNTDVTSGLSTRDELQNNLGAPFISNEELNVSVYKVLTGHDVRLMGPIILPLDVDVEEVIIYALVVYDDDGIVKDIDWGVYHENEVRTTLEASGFRFDSYSVWENMPHTEFLLAPLPDSQKSLHMQSPPGACALFVTPQDYIGDTYCSPAEYYGEVIYIDGKPLVDHPVAFPGFFKILLPVGEHELAASILTPGFFTKKPIYFRSKFLCESGKSLYATPYIQVRDSGEFWDWNKITYQGEILIKNVPWIFQDLQQILFYAGKWFYQ